MSKTKTGTSIYVDDALRAPLIDFEIEGKTTQETRSGKNLYNVFDKNNTFTTDSDGWITINVNNSGGSSTVFSNFYVNKSNLLTTSTDYALMIEIKSVSGSGVLVLSENDNAFQFETNSTIATTSLTANSVLKRIIRTKSDYTSANRMIKNYVYVSAGSSCSIVLRLSVLADTSITTDNFVYEPYGVMPSPDYPSDLVSVGTYNSETGKYGIEVISTGKNLLSSDFTQASANTIATEINNFPAGTYTLSYNIATAPTQTQVKIKQDNQWVQLKSVINVKSLTFTLDNTYDIRFETWRSNGNPLANYSNFMLEKGLTVTAYEPYQSNTQLYQLDNPIRSIGNTKDLLYIRNGMLYVERKIGSVVLNGTQSISAIDTSFTNTTKVAYYNLLVSNPAVVSSNTTRPMSNYFVGKGIWSVDEEGLYTDNKNVVFRANKTIIGTTTNDVNTWLSTHNTEVQYILATPYIETLGEVNILNTYKGTNSIIIHSGIKTNTTIEYVNDFTTADKQALRNNTAAIKCKLTVLADGNLPVIELTENNSVKDWEYSDERLVPGQGFVGQFVGRTLDGNLQNISDTFNIIGRTINLNLGIYRINDDVTTWYDFGNFVVTEPENNEVNDNTKFESMDYAKLFNKQFNGDYTDAVFTTSYNDLMGVNLSDEERATFIVTPVTARWVALYTCAQVGVTLATTDFINNDFQIDTNPFQAGETCRDVMKAIGKLALSWVRIGWDNRCYIDFGIEDTVDTYDVLDNNQYFSLETVEDTIPIDGVGFGMKDIDGETAFKIKNDQPIGSAENILYVYDNPFLYTFDKRYQAVQNATAIFGLTFTQLQTETIGHPWLTGTELINVKDMEDASNYTYPFNKTIKYSGHIRSVISSVDETEVEKTLGYTSSTIQSARKASINVNKQEGTIDLLTSRVSVVEDGLGNTYTKEETNSLVSDVSGLTNQYLTSGGANKFRNTGLWYKNDDGSGFEYWTGSVQVVNDDNSATSTAMMLQNNTLTQTLSNVPNGDYTISFKYEKLNPTSSLQILINSTDYSELLSTSGTFEQTFTVSTNSIEISFICNTNNGWKIYELMCNVGSAPLVWTQHPNEVRTDTVNISKGITITSSTTNAVFKANADGIRIENQLERTTTNFLEDGMETDNATIRKQARVSGALHTIVGNQTWISGIL